MLNSWFPNLSKHYTRKTNQIKAMIGVDLLFELKCMMVAGLLTQQSAIARLGFKQEFRVYNNCSVT
ncbi:MAG: hypothetical protein VKN72_22695 [Nostocales cyanobacterium 94392]|nr:hypothetical protein [Nostocales cyanobacterium 94392]